MLQPLLPRRCVRDRRAVLQLLCGFSGACSIRVCRVPLPRIGRPSGWLWPAAPCGLFALLARTCQQHSQAAPVQPCACQCRTAMYCRTSGAMSTLSGAVGCPADALICTHKWGVRGRASPSPSPSPSERRRRGTFTQSCDRNANLDSFLTEPNKIRRPPLPCEDNGTT